MNEKIVFVLVGSRETRSGALGNLFGQCAGVHMDRNSCVKGESGDLAMYYVRGEERVLVAIFGRQERFAPEE